jgi:uncharacterized delta-60 repeat protein
MRNTDCRKGRLTGGGIGRVLALVAVVLPACVASSADGDLDPGWGSGGLAFTGVSETGNRGMDVAVQCDGKVVAVGAVNSQVWSSDAGVIRFDTDGSLDTSFASSGVFDISFGPFGDIGMAVALQADGKIIVAGTGTENNTDQFFVLRLTANGDLDSTFSGDGYHLFGFDGPARANAVAVQDDGRIVVAGRASTDSAMAIARLTTTGGLDPTFDGDGDSDGKVLIDFALGHDEAWDVVVQDDGRILVAGTAATIDGSFAAVVRLLADGSFDTSFGPGASGATAIDFGTYSEGRGLTLQENGKIVVTGFTDYLTSVAVARLTDGGILDPSFDGDGMVTRDFGIGSDEGRDVAVQRDGRVVVAGSVEGATGPDATLMRFTSTGDIDTSFGSGGETIIGLSSPSVLYGMALQPTDGQIIAAGLIDYGIDDSNVLVLRAVGDSTLIFDSGFECGDTSAWSSSVP